VGMMLLAKVGAYSEQQHGRRVRWGEPWQVGHGGD